MIDLVSLVRAYSERVNNNRTPETILAHMKGEVVELEQEIPANDGKDGVVGESIDVILCALDLIFKHSPHVTNEEILAIADKKCRKWEANYGEPNDDLHQS